MELAFWLYMNEAEGYDDVVDTSYFENAGIK